MFSANFASGCAFLRQYRLAAVPRNAVRAGAPTFPRIGLKIQVLAVQGRERQQDDYNKERTEGL